MNISGNYNTTDKEVGIIARIFDIYEIPYKSISKHKNADDADILVLLPNGNEILIEVKEEFINRFSSEKTNRNRTIIELFNEISEDRCAICGTTKTFENNRTGRQHFEIHHVISYKNGKDLDNIANLVKLCPTCHDMLRKNASSKEQQQKAIIKILSEHPEVLEFAKSYLQIDDINEIAEEIWEKLG